MFSFNSKIETPKSLDSILSIFTDTKASLLEFIETSTKRHEEVKVEIESIQKRFR